MAVKLRLKRMGSNGVSTLVNKGVVGFFDTIARLAEE